MRNGELGFWWRSIGGQPPARPALGGPAEADVAIVGAGFTGLWTAYYLKRADPALRVIVLEREQAGFGASGRNGGWVTGFFSGPARVYDSGVGDAGYAALQRAMFDTVDEVGDVVQEHGIGADFVKDGHVTVAVNEAQAARLRARVARARELGLGEGDICELAPRELEARVRVAGARAATFSPHVARVHPAKLVAGLAGLVESLGVTVYEHTAVTGIDAHEARTAVGAVRARWVVRATEGYTASLPGQRRSLVPMNSSMIITAPVPEALSDEIGWRGAHVLSDGAHVYCYLQRTADGRIAIGGRGSPYRFGSRTGGAGATPQATVASLRERLAQMFPVLGDVEIEHAWSGVLGVPRDWSMSLVADPASGLAWAGGYVGEGVASANLAGRTLCDLLLDRAGGLQALPWVGRRPPRWEPEPIRWAAIHALYSLYRAADRGERRGSGPSRLARVLDGLSGRR